MANGVEFVMSEIATRPLAHLTFKQRANLVATYLRTKRTEGKPVARALLRVMLTELEPVTGDTTHAIR